MTPNERLAVEAIRLTLTTYTETRRRTRDDLTKALAEVKMYIPRLIADGIKDRTQLAVKALTRLRELEPRPPVLPIWMRRRVEVADAAEPQIEDQCEDALH
jgi:hypothetical protein